MSSSFVTSIGRAIRAEHDLHADEKLMELLNSYYVVHIDNDIEFSEKLTWCLEHCQDKFRDLSIRNGRSWYFKSEQDALIFAMKWA